VWLLYACSKQFYRLTNLHWIKYKHQNIRELHRHPRAAVHHNVAIFKHVRAFDYVLFSYKIHDDISNGSRTFVFSEQTHSLTNQHYWIQPTSLRRRCAYGKKKYLSITPSPWTITGQEILHAFSVATSELNKMFVFISIHPSIHPSVYLLAKFQHNENNNTTDKKPS